jgi:methyltransferase (TIGR00027 family)
MEELPARLAALGHDAREPTFTLWEGVTMYLSERAVHETVASVHAWSAPGSRLAMEYFRRASIVERPGLERLVAGAVLLRDEPFRFGWEPWELPTWLAARGFVLEVDHADAALARQHLSPGHLRMFHDARGAWEFHLALARRG